MTDYLPEPSIRTLIVASGLSLTSMIVGILSATIVSVALVAVIGVSDEGLAITVAAGIALNAGFALVAIGYVSRRKKGLAYLGLDLPDRREISLTFVLLIVTIVIGTATDVLLPLAESDVQAQLEGSEWLVMLLVAPLLINPIEELLFRGVVQTRIEESFSSMVAIILSGLFFGLAHVPAYVDPAIGEALFTFISQAVLGMIFGVGYAKTGKLIVPIAIHSLYSVYLYSAFFIGIV